LPSSAGSWRRAAVEQRRRHREVVEIRLRRAAPPAQLRPACRSRLRRRGRRRRPRSNYRRNPRERRRTQNGLSSLVMCGDSNQKVRNCTLNLAVAASLPTSAPCLSFEWSSLGGRRRSNVWRLSYWRRYRRPNRSHPPPLHQPRYAGWRSLLAKKLARQSARSSVPYAGKWPQHWVLQLQSWSFTNRLVEAARQRSPPARGLAVVLSLSAGRPPPFSLQSTSWRCGFRS